MSPPRAKHHETLRGKVRAHDPFELIRWLALSQPDPRKALAELVQNSLDAGARHIHIERFRHNRVPCLRVLDDGEGVIPEMDRKEALRYVATHIGHSRKQSLSPQQRLELMTQGQYGIGLLGFWSLGQALDIRSSVPGQSPHRLALYRDRPHFLIEPIRGRFALDELRTEVVVSDLHREASTAISGRRAADYLALELRGQLLSRDVELIVNDRITRRQDFKNILVRPPRFLGEKIEGIGSIDVADHPPIRFELYLGGEAENGAGTSGIAVYAAGTMVADGFHELGALGLDHPPWTDTRLTGLVDFPGLRIAPGSRRGIIPDRASEVFAGALASMEPTLLGILESIEQRIAEDRDRGLIRDLQRAFRNFYRQRPRFALLPVSEQGDRGGGADAGGNGAPGGAGEEAPQGRAGEAPDTVEVEERELENLELLPPGPLAAIRLSPSSIRVACSQTRTVTAIATDATGRSISDPVDYAWSVIGPVGELAEVPGAGNKINLVAASQPGTGSIRVAARSGKREVVNEAMVGVVEELEGARSDEGIPEPDFIRNPGGRWRSRMVEERWQVNASHPEYRAAAQTPALKLRYLAMLFAKEVVLRSNQDPRLDQPLEQLVEIASYADLNLTRVRPPGGRKRKGRYPPP